MILTFGRIVLFFISSYGYFRWIETKFHYHQRLSWIVIYCGNVLVLYVFSFAGLLRESAWTMFGIGLLAGIYQIIKKQKRLFKIGLTFDFVKIGIGFYFILFASTLIRSHLIHYDNFSHWALIVKYFLTESALPDAASAIISFSSYPVGSSLFVYYFTLLSGYTEGVMLLGQFVFILAAIYAMFAVVRDDRKLLTVSVMFVVITAFNHFNIAIRMNNLLVDFILPLLALAALSGIYVFRHNLIRMSVHTAMVLSVLSIVKNSGLFFVVLVLFIYMVYLIKFIRRSGFKFSSLLTGLITAAGSIATYLVWSFHLDQTFTDAEISKHSVSLTSYQEIFSEKTGEIIEVITDQFLQTIFSRSSLSTQGVLLIQALFIFSFLTIRFGFHKKNQLLKTLVIVDLAIVLYYTGILLMFLFSMPIDEALELAGFERYVSSMVIFGLGIFAMSVVQEIDRTFYEQQLDARNHRAYKNVRTKQLYQYTSILFVFFSTAMLLSENNGMLYNNAGYEDTYPAKIKAVAGDEQDLNDRSYLIVSSDKESVENYYIPYIGKYYLYTDQVEAREDFIMSDEEFIAVLSNYDYIVLIEDHYTFNELSKKLFQIEVSNGIYETEELLALMGDSPA